MDERLKTALGALDSGNLPLLSSLLRADTDLVTARVKTHDAPYEGYFADATLLHHVAGNPRRGELPANVVDVAKLLIDCGADVEAECGGGPAQPDSGGGTTLGLVASGAQGAKQGLSEALIDTLLGAGADVNRGNGGCLFTALYHTVEYRGQRDVAAVLYDRGAEVDLAFAAGLGKLDLVEGFFDESGALLPNAYCLYRPSSNRLASPSDGDILLEALIYAAANGRTDVARALLDRGANINDVASFGAARVTPLHAACWAGWRETAEFLVSRGADPTTRDPMHDSTPPGWAHYCGRTDVVEYFRDSGARLDLLDSIALGMTDRVRDLLVGIDVNAGQHDGSPGVLLRTAAFAGHLPIVTLLLAAGADPTLANPDGVTALDLAVGGGHKEIAAALERALP